MDDDDALDAVLEGIGTRRGKGDEAVVDVEGDRLAVGKTNAMSPLLRRVGTSWTPLLRMMPLG